MSSEPRPRPPTGIPAVLTATRTATGAPRGRRLLGLLGLVGLPVLITVFVAIFAEGGRGSGFTGFSVVTMAYLGLILPIVLVFLGTGVFGDEWAGGTAHYVVGVPVPRYALIVGRWLASVRRALMLLLPAVALVYVVSLARYEGALTHYLGDLLWVLVVMSYLGMAYCAIFMLFGLWLKRAVMTSLAYVFVCEMLIGSLPQTFASLSLGFHARNILWQTTEKDGFQLVTTNVVAVAPLGVLHSVLVIAAVTAIALLASVLLLRVKECGGEVDASEAAAT